MRVLSGKKIAQKIKKQVAKDINKLGQAPGLAVLLVGNDPASRVYVGLKKKACREVGIKFFLHKFSSNVGTEKIINTIKSLNQDKRVHGILVQLPLPKRLPTSKIIRSMDPEKDPDYFHPTNLKKIANGKNLIFPPTLSGILVLLKKAKRRIAGKKVLIISNSQTFALPLVAALKQKKAKTTLIKANDKYLKNKTKKADIIVTAIGKKWFIDESMIKNKSILIDIGCSRVGKKVFGDINPNVAKKAAYLAPVPGGVGPLTVVCLLENVVKLVGGQ